MKECMEKDNPLVSIVLAVYNPRMDWFREQLISLENQSYCPLKLLIVDDCSSSITIEELNACVKECVKKIPYQILRNDENLGSNRTFEKLTILAEGKYIAYCDQDDIWHREKIEVCVDTLESTQGDLVFSDMNVIDGAGKFLANSMTKVRKHHKFYSGEGLAEKLLFHNFVTGCTILMKAESAKAAVPFCPYMVHDHWLALYSAAPGKITFIQEQLIDYRIHEKNQTLVMAGVTDKESYMKIRIEQSFNKFSWLKEHWNVDKNLKGIIQQGHEWISARRNNFNKAFSRDTIVILRYRKFSLLPSLFEIGVFLLPEKVFLFFIILMRKNII